MGPRKFCTFLTGWNAIWTVKLADQVPSTGDLNTVTAMGANGVILVGIKVFNAWCQTQTLKGIPLTGKECAWLCPAENQAADAVVEKVIAILKSQFPQTWVAIGKKAKGMFRSCLDVSPQIERLVLGDQGSF